MSKVRNAHVSNATKATTKQINEVNPLHCVQRSDKDIVIVTDYHAKAVEYRWLDLCTGEERTFNRATSAASIETVLDEARSLALPRGGQAVWIMESTSGWARVLKLLAGRASFVMANVLQMPLPPKARRHKTDKLDTARLLREYLNGELPRAHQPDEMWRMARRVVAAREDLVRRRRTLRNQVKAYFMHETWENAGNFWSGSGAARLKELIEKLPADDRFTLTLKIDELEDLEPRIAQAEKKITELYGRWPDARRLDSIRGIAVVAAVSIIARIGPIDRFRTPEQLIAYAGLCPGISSSDERSRHLSIGGGGTDKQLRHYLIEATVWAREIPRYQPSYERVAKKRGNKVARIVVARMLLRSIYQMLKTGQPFRPAA